MTAAIVQPSPIGGSGQQFFDNNGAVLAGGLVYTYAAGSTTPVVSYTDGTGLVANANPVVLNSAGRSSGIWLVSGTSYKIVLKTSVGVTLGTWDNLTLLYGATTAQIAATTANTAAITVLNATKSGFRAYLSAGTTAIGAIATVVFDSEVYDRLSEYNPATGVWTPTVAGTYLITAGLYFNLGGAGNYLGRLYNGAAVARYWLFDVAAGAGDRIFTASDIVRVTVGDTYLVKVSTTSGAGPVLVGGNNATYFDAQYLGPT